MKQDSKHELEPKLRFPEFVGHPWRVTWLKDVTVESTTRNAEKLQPKAVMGVTKAEGIVPMKERLIGEDVSRYKIVRKNWFAYNPMRLNIGSIARWQGDSDIVVSPDYVVFLCPEEIETAIDPGFLDQYRRSDHWHDFVTNSGIGSVRVRIYYKDIARLGLPLPKLAEQQKIADCLTALDQLIAAQTGKVDALKSHKKGLMQQLFPREGENQPRLRFPEFRDTGEWKYSLLGKLAKRVATKNGILSQSRVLTNSAEFGVVDQGSYFDREIVTKSNLGTYYIVERGDFVYNPRISTLAPVGPVSRNNLGTGVMSPLYTVFRFDTQATDFFMHLFKTSVWHPYLKDISNSGARHDRMSITTADFMRLPLLVPSPDEQQRIADCFSNLAEHITAQTQKLDALKTYKKGLMQKLFASSEDEA